MKIKLIDFGAGKAGMLPLRAHHNDAGADVYALETFRAWPKSTTKVPLGFGLELPDGMVGYIFPRSSLASKGLIAELPPIDSGYRGEIHAILTNHSQSDIWIEKGSRIGQLVILPVVLPDLTLETLDERGTGAFGSTGK